MSETYCPKHGCPLTLDLETDKYTCEKCENTLYSGFENIAYQDPVTKAIEELKKKLKWGNNLTAASILPLIIEILEYLNRVR